MKIFNFDPADYADQYARTGWVHIPGGIDPEFLAHLKDFTARRFAEQHVEGKAIGGAKEQALFEFPAETDFPGELFDSIAALCGLDREGMTLSERHIKAYDPDVPPEQTAHKDRYASQVSVGLSIDIPAESRLVLYPHDEVWENPHNVSAALLEDLPPEKHPDTVLEGAREVEIDDTGGDLVAFRGSAIWHFRRRAASAVNLYLKMNDFGCDPLGEDPSTPARREATLAALDGGGNGSIESLVPVPARRLDAIERRYLREEWSERLEARVWESPPVPLADEDLRLLRELDGTAAMSELGGRLGLAPDALAERVRALAADEVIDLIAPAS